MFLSVKGLFKVNKHKKNYSKTYPSLIVELAAQNCVDYLAS